MPVVACSSCQVKLNIPESVLGKKARCPSCHEVFTAESATKPIPVLDVVDEGNIADRQPGRPVSDLSRVKMRPVDDDFDRRRKPRSVAKSGSRLVLWLVLGGIGLLALGGMGVAGIVYLVFRDRTIPDSEWREFSPAGANYSVLMPGTPTLDNAALNGAPGNKYVLNYRQGALALVVAHIDLPGLPVDQATLKMLSDAEKDQLLQKVQGKLVYDKEIRLNGHLGKEFEIEAKDRTKMLQRVYLANHAAKARIYLVMIAETPLYSRASNRDKFLGSFKILGPEPPRLK
jgi:hypothetical protein